MSVRGLDDGDDSGEQRIERTAESKGLELDDIEVESDETDDGDPLKRYLVYETKAETEADSVGVQITKMVGTDMSDVSFQQSIDSKLSSLARYVRGGSQNEDDLPDPDEHRDSSGSRSDKDSVERSDVSAPVEPSGDSHRPGETLDAELNRIEARLNEMEQRVEDIEEKAEALDGLQKLMNGDD